MVMIGSGLAAFVSYGMLNWIPAFLMRTQGMPLPPWPHGSPRPPRDFRHRHSRRRMARQPGGAAFAPRLWLGSGAGESCHRAQLRRRVAGGKLAGFAGAAAAADGGLHRLCRARALALVQNLARPAPARRPPPC
jgi:hypothetical protein